jgi:hypothetical protein
MRATLILTSACDRIVRAMTRLTGEQVRSLSYKLASTLNLDELKSIVYASTGDQLFVQYVGPGKPLRPTIEDLLNELEAAGTTVFFLAYVYKYRREGRPDVAEAINKAFPEAAADLPLIESNIQVQEAGKPQTDGPDKAATPGFERNIRPYLTQLDVHVWVEKLARIERRVCRIEINGNAAGTGFLVGPDVVLTNWHVVRDTVNGDGLGALTCRFDYYRLVNGSRNPGISVEVAKNGCVSHRPFSEAETTATPDKPPPTDNELDYALLRLAIGPDNFGDQPRGWIALPERALETPAGTPVLIVQHPDGAPLKLALDTNAVIGSNANQTRIRYATNTEAGSSGSPCFDMEWNLFALHHYGDPAWLRPMFNQGVPAHLIKQKIVSDGFAGLLGR